VPCWHAQCIDPSSAGFRERKPTLPQDDICGRGTGRLNSSRARAPRGIGRRSLAAQLKLCPTQTGIELSHATSKCIDPSSVGFRERKPALPQDDIGMYVKACAIPRDKIGMYELRLAFPEDDWMTAVGETRDSGIPRELAAPLGESAGEAWRHS